MKKKSAIAIAVLTLALGSISFAKEGTKGHEDAAVKTCKEQGKKGKELSDCIRTEREKGKEAKKESPIEEGEAKAPTSPVK